MARVRFTQTVSIGQTRFPAGDEVPEADIPPGNLASLKRLGLVAPVAPPDPADEFAAAMEGRAAPPAAGPEKPPEIGPAKPPAVQTRKK